MAVKPRIQSVARYHMATYDAVIKKIYQGLLSPSDNSLIDRIVKVSEFFLNKPYLLGASGEGSNGEFDQNPIYRTDAFDCLTLVNTVIALAFANSLSSFRQRLLQINYYNADPKYQNRFHFMSIDWNIQNAKQGIVRDVTTEVGKDSYHIAKADVNRPNWFQYRNFSDIKLLNPISVTEANQLLTKLRNFSSVVRKETSKLAYISLTQLFKDGRVNQSLFQRIPHGSIIEIVRPNWNLYDKIGTNLNVSHLGFALHFNNELIFREASSIEAKVIDVPLQDYLRNYLTSETVKGINIQELIVT